MCCGGNCTGNCGNSNVGNFTYVRYATNAQGSNMSKYIDKNNNGDIDGLTRCYQSIFVSPIQLDENSLLFPTHFTEWSYGCSEDCGCGGCEWFDYHRHRAGNSWSYDAGFALLGDNNTYENVAEAVNMYNGDVITIPFLSDSDGNLLQSGTNYCFEMRFDPTLFTSSDSSVEVRFGNGTGSTLISYDINSIIGLVKMTVTPISGILSAHNMIITLVNNTSAPGTEIIDFKIFNFRLAPESCCQEGDCGCNCNINMIPLELILGEEINFVHTDYGSEIDIIEPSSTEITRGVSQSIYNTAIELGYQTGSPYNTEWNSSFTDLTNNGFSNLFDIKTRVYSDFVTALDNAVGTNVVGAELIMHDLSTDKYYKFLFSAWTQGANGGGFAYTRQEVDVTEPCKITFSDGTVQSTAAGKVVAGTNITVDETIIGGERTFTINATGGEVNYSNVIFIDHIYGNNATGAVGDFTKPFASLYNAIALANSMSPSSYNKILIYIRRGTYNTNVYLSNFVDYYCEPGVVFDGTCIVQDIYGDCISNFYGYAVFLNSYLNVLQLNNTSTVTFEFDYIATNGRAFGLISNAGKTVTANIKGNFIYCTTLGTGHGLTIRNNVNAIINISRGIEAVHSTIEFRNHTGNVEINCPKIYIGVGNIYGGNFKQAIVVYGASNTSFIKVNADLENKDVSPIGSNTGLLVMWGGTSGTFELNGNIVAGNILAIHSNNVANNGTVTVNGNTSSTFDYGIWIYGGTMNFILNGGKHLINGLTGLAVVSTNGSSTAYLNGCAFYNSTLDKDILIINGLASSIVVNNCTGVSEGVSGYAVKAGAVGLIYIHSSRFNKPLDPSLTDSYTPSGLLVDILTKVPKF
jgi:hypothetical protein